MPFSCAYQTTCSTDLSASTFLYQPIPNRDSSNPSSDCKRPDLGMPTIHHGCTSWSRLMGLTAEQTGKDKLEPCASAFSLPQSQLSQAPNYASPCPRDRPCFALRRFSESQALRFQMPLFAPHSKESVMGGGWMQRHGVKRA